MIELNHLSYSSISSYQNCARSWRYKYLDKIATPPSLSLVFGSAVHEIIESAIRTPDTDPLAAFTRHWEKESSQLDMIDANKGQQDGLAVFKSPAVLALIAGIKPKYFDGVPAIERKIELRVPGVPVPVIGFIDVIHEDGVPGDLKTAARMWPEDKPANETQPLFYLAALAQAGEMPVPARFRHHVIVKNSKVDVRTFETEYRLSSLLWLFQSIADVWHGIQSNAFPPSPGSWLCSDKFCGYWHLCRGRK